MDNENLNGLDSYSLDSILIEFGSGSFGVEPESSVPPHTSTENDESDGKKVSDFYSEPRQTSFEPSDDDGDKDVHISDNTAGDKYAKAGDYGRKRNDEDEDEDEDDGDKPSSGRSRKESSLSPIIAFLAFVVMKIQQSKLNFRGAPPEEAEDLGEEMSPDRAVKFYKKHIPWLRLRARFALLLSLVMAYISFGFPVPGALADTGVKAAVLLIMLLTVTLLGLDVFVSGILALVKRRPHANSLVALSCLFSIIDAFVVACGVKAYGIPYCAVAALTMTFTLFASLLNCRANRLSCHSADALRNPFTLTAETSVSGEGITLLKSRCGTKDFIRRTEEFSPDEAAFSMLAPYLIIISLILSVIAAAIGGNFKGYAHILSGIFVFAAPFALLFSFPLPFFVGAKKLINVGSSVAGWSGLFDIGKSKHIIISDNDLFSKKDIHVKKAHYLSGANSEELMSLAATVISASGSALTPAFIELMHKANGSLLRMDDFKVHEGGGLVALISGEEILCGPAGFMQLMGVRLPKALALKDCVFLSASGILKGFFEIDYTPKQEVHDSLLKIMRSNRHPIFALRDFNMTPQMLSRKFDIPTDGFDFPSFIERYEISAASPTDASKPAALMSKDGLDALITLADYSRLMYKSVRICVLLSIMSTVLGIVLAFSYFCSASFAAVTAAKVMVYMLLWLLPEVILTIILARKKM